MSAIFKTRKTPRHLVIQPELPIIRKKRRVRWPRLLLILVLGLVLTWSLMQMG